MLLEHFQGLHDHRVVLVDVLGPCLFIQPVVDDSAVEDSIQKLVRLSDEQVSALQAVRVCIAYEFLYDVLSVKIVGKLHHLLEIVQFRTVVIGIGERKLKDETAHARLLEVGSHTECILRYEDIWSDTTATINHTTDACMISRTGMLDAILREELAVLIAGQQVLLVILVITQGVRLLDASARWSIVAGDGETDEAVVRELNLLLNQTLTERTATDDGSTVVVLHGTGEDFSRRCRTLVDENHQWYFLISTLAVARIFLAWRLSAFGIENQLLGWQELVRHVDSGSKITA